MSRLFLKPRYLDMLLEIFRNYCPNAEIWAYGSRISGEAHEASDLDLVVKSFNDSSKNIYELKELVNNSDIPIIVDILDYNNIPESFQKEIEKNYIVIFGAEKV